MASWTDGRLLGERPVAELRNQENRTVRLEKFASDARRNTQSTSEIENPDRFLELRPPPRGTSIGMNMVPFDFWAGCPAKVVAAQSSGKEALP